MISQPVTQQDETPTLSLEALEAQVGLWTATCEQLEALRRAVQAEGAQPALMLAIARHGRAAASRLKAYDDRRRALKEQP